MSYNYIERINENFCTSFNAMKTTGSVFVLKCVSDLSFIKKDALYIQHPRIKILVSR
jgi:hypothetical protein